MKGPVSYVDQNGEKVSGGSPSVLARKLFLEKSCSIILVSENGFELYISYYPAVEMFWARGYFSLSEAETETLNKIFKLEYKQKGLLICNQRAFFILREGSIFSL